MNGIIEDRITYNIDGVILYFSEDENVLDAKPVNNPKKLWDAMENSRIIETNNMAVVDCFRGYVKERLVKNGIIRYKDETFKLDKHGRYIIIPSYDEEHTNSLLSLL